MALSSKSILAIAMVCHAVNAGYCRHLGDDSQPDWDSAPEWQQSSAVAGVQFHLDNPDAGDEAAHENWMKAKIADGWVYGETKDTEKKTHPCIVPFDQLPKEQQFKDQLFRSIVLAAAPQFQQDDDALEAITAERDMLTSAAAAVKSAPKATAIKAPSVRKISADVVKDPLEGEQVGDDYVSREAKLLTAIAGAGKVEIAFSDGKREIAGMDPVEVTGNAWRVTVAGVQLSIDELIADTPAKGVFPLAGYGLFLDGKLAAYRDRGGQLSIAAGSRQNIAPDVVF
jgi:hypothetical protein